MEKLQIDSFQIIGISVRTINHGEKAKKDIGELWNKFMSENVREKIPNVIDEAIYAVYTDYEKDYTKPYTTILGYKVSSLDKIPEGMVGKQIDKSQYRKFIAKGDLTNNVVINEWIKIWNLDIDRKYTADFEIYGEKAMDPKDAEVDIFIALN